MHPQTPRTSTRTAACAALLLALLAPGCLMQANYEVQYTAADGVVLDVPLSRNFRVEAGDDAVTLANFQFMPLKSGDVRTMAYAFELKFLGSHEPAKIVMEDDTELPILELMTDASPKFFKDKLYLGHTPGFNPNDAHMTWINSLDNGVKVYRITITMKDGSVHVLRAPVFVPAEAKSMFRIELGVK